MRIAVAGGGGVLGRAVVPRLRALGHEVRLLARAAAGADCVPGDLLQPDSLRPWLHGCDAALHLATALRATAGGAVDWAANDRVRTLGTANLLQACAHQGVPRVVVQSVAFVRGSAQDHWCDGDEPLADLPFLASATAMERLARESGLDSVVVRGGLFYGPGTLTSARWASAAAAGAWRMPANADDYVSLVHVDDMADAIAAATNCDARAVVAAVDDEPVRWGDLVRGLRSIAGGELLPALDTPALLPSFRVSNRRARELLGWKPNHASWRDGVRGEPWARGSAATSSILPGDRTCIS